MDCEQEQQRHRLEFPFSGAKTSLPHWQGRDVELPQLESPDLISWSPLLAYNKRSWANLTANARQCGQKGMTAAAGWQTGSATATESRLWTYRELDPAQIVKLCEIHSYTHTKCSIFIKKLLQINCLYDYCWESWRWDGNYDKMFFKSRKKRNQPPMIRSLLCSCCTRETAQMRSCYSTAFLQYSAATLPALYICSEDFWLLADPEKSFPRILLSATAWTAEIQYTIWWNINMRPMQK